MLKLIVWDRQHGSSVNHEQDELDKVIRELEAKFEFLPYYIREKDKKNHAKAFDNVS